MFLFNLQSIIVFLIAEAGGLIPVCCLCLYVLLTLVHRARIKLFSVFLVSDRGSCVGLNSMVMMQLG